jgi:phosphoribosyl 1,2-cyclic phosphodiesterase
MGLRFTVLASGSGGNASLVETDTFGLLIDAGIGPRMLAQRLAAVGQSWAAINAVLLTHTHTDHWRDRTLAHLWRRQIPFYCHSGHGAFLHHYSPAFRQLAQADLLRSFDAHCCLEIAPGLHCQPLPIRHDGGPTFGFRIEGGHDLFGHPAALAYVADLGSWDESLVERLADVDLLAVEFNHDVSMENMSGRSPMLIARVLGDDGHLSNEQAASLVRAVLARSPAGRLRHLVQLHLSRECNRPSLARETLRALLVELNVNATVHTADQHVPGTPLDLRTPVVKRRQPRSSNGRARLEKTVIEPWLPGLDGQV